MFVQHCSFAHFADKGSHGSHWWSHMSIMQIFITNKEKTQEQVHNLNQPRYDLTRQADPRPPHTWSQCFFYWRNIVRWWFFFQKLIFLLPKFSSNLTIFHLFEQIFIKFWWFHPNSGQKCCTFYFIGAICSINENLQKKHCFVLTLSPWQPVLHTRGWMGSEAAHLYQHAAAHQSSRVFAQVFWHFHKPL
jgi:hypothetical protein